MFLSCYLSAVEGVYLLGYISSHLVGCVIVLSCLELALKEWAGVAGLWALCSQVTHERCCSARATVLAEGSASPGPGGLPGGGPGEFWLRGQRMSHLGQHWLQPERG